MSIELIPKGQLDTFVGIANDLGQRYANTLKEISELQERLIAAEEELHCARESLRVNAWIHGENLELKTENVKLQSIIDEAKQQEFVGEVCQQNQERYFTCLAASYETKPIIGMKLYAYPMPTEQNTGNINHDDS